MPTRSLFIKASLGLIFLKPEKPYVWTIKGKLKTARMGQTLIHEHFLVDFIGADKISPNRWDREAVVEKVLPFLLEARARGIRTILDCTIDKGFKSSDIAQLLVQNPAEAFAIRVRKF